MYTHKITIAVSCTRCTAQYVFKRFAGSSGSMLAVGNAGDDGDDDDDDHDHDHDHDDDDDDDGDDDDGYDDDDDDDDD